MSCFRDDLVFVVFLYQRWVYRVDMSRVNEFGHRGEGNDADAGADGCGKPVAGTKGKSKKAKQQ